MPKILLIVIGKNIKQLGKLLSHKLKCICYQFYNFQKAKKLIQKSQLNLDFQYIIFLSFLEGSHNLQNSKYFKKFLQKYNKNKIIFLKPFAKDKIKVNILFEKIKNYAQPGVIFLDHLNKDFWFENFRLKAKFSRKLSEAIFLELMNHITDY